MTSWQFWRWNCLICSWWRKTPNWPESQLDTRALVAKQGKEDPIVQLYKLTWGESFILYIYSSFFSFNSCNFFLKFPEYLLGEAFDWLNKRNIKHWWIQQGNRNECEVSFHFISGCTSLWDIRLVAKFSVFISLKHNYFCHTYSYRTLRFLFEPVFYKLVIEGTVSLFTWSYSVSRVARCTCLSLMSNFGFWWYLKDYTF